MTSSAISIVVARGNTSRRTEGMSVVRRDDHRDLENTPGEHLRGSALASVSEITGFSWYFSDGASRDRTGDLLLAKQALSQLSYGPVAHGS